MSAETLPENKLAEVIVLGALMSEADLGFEDVSKELTKDHFLNRSHRLIFSEIRELRKQDLPVNSVILTGHFELLGKLDEIGGAHYISKLSSSFCTLPHFKHYVSLLVEALRLRRIISLADNLGKIAKGEMAYSNEILSKLEQDILEISDSNNSDGKNRLQPASDELQRMIDVRKSGEKVFGLDSGISGFNEIFGGFQKGQYYVLAARPSTGKTAFADQVTVHLITRGHPVMYISLEAGEERVLGKMACKLAQVSFSDFSLGKCSLPELEEIEVAKNLLKKSPLILIRPSDLTSNDIRTLIRREVKSHKIELVVLDYLQKITVPPRTEMRVAIGDASQQIAKACVETGVPALVLAQLNRETEKESRPRMGHLKESGQIEQDADNIALLWPEVDRSTLQPGAKVPIIMTVEKNKDGISQIDQKLLFNGRLMTFERRLVH